MYSVNKLVDKWSETAEIRYFENGEIAVDNYDQDISFDGKACYPATVKRDEHGCLLIEPKNVSVTNCRGPRFICDATNGIGYIYHSPHYKNRRVVMTLPYDVGTKKAFKKQLDDLFDLLDE